MMHFIILEKHIIFKDLYSFKLIPIDTSNVSDCVGVISFYFTNS